MQDFAQIRKTNGGNYPYQLNTINRHTGKYYPACTKYFATLQDAKEYAKENQLTVTK